MTKNWIGALALAASLFVPAVALAAPEPTDPKRQTAWGLYLTAPEAAALKAEKGAAALFVDVREPIEIMFTGFTDVVDINIPFLLVNPSKWSADKPVFAMERNPDFAASVQKALEERGLDTSAPVILMCRSGGERGAPSAKALEGLGLRSVYVVVDGFEGDTDKKNPKGPWRAVNGWKNSGLPWSYDLNPEKIYTRAAK
jgi:rhodanese-related sulfurtransferase